MDTNKRYPWKHIVFGLVGVIFYSNILAAEPTTAIVNSGAGNIETATSSPNLVSQNLNNRLQDLASFNQDIPSATSYWPTENINLSAFGNFDITPKTMQKTLPGEENNYFAISNLGINADANLASFMSAHVGVAYFETNKGQGNRYTNTGLILDDAYFTLANFNKTPFFLEGGQFYLPFGEYDRYAIIPSLPQILSITRETGVQAGIMNWYGITGSFYATEGQLEHEEDPSSRYNGTQDYINYGAALHYQYGTEQDFNFGLGAEYMYNMLNTNALSESDGLANNDYTYTDPIGGVAFQAKAGYKWLTLFADYVTALTASDDLIKIYEDPKTKSNPIYGAKPSAWDAGFITKFHLFGLAQQIDFTYSHSTDSAGLYVFNSSDHGLPEARYVAGYSIDITKNILFRFQWGHDWLYPEGEGDDGTEGDDITLRLGLKF